MGRPTRSQPSNSPSGADEGAATANVNDPQPQQSDNLESFLRSLPGSRQDNQEEPAPTNVKPEPEPMMDIPDPDNSPAPDIVVSEWSSAEAEADPNDANAAEAAEGDGGEEFILGLAEPGEPAPADSGDTPISGQPKGRPRRVGIVDKPGPKSRKRLQLQKRGSTPRSRSSSASPTKSQSPPSIDDPDSSPTRKRRRKKRRARYGLTKDDLKEAMEAIAKAVSDCEDEKPSIPRLASPSQILSADSRSGIKQKVHQPAPAQRKPKPKRAPKLSSRPKPVPKSRQKTADQESREIGNDESDEERIAVELTDAGSTGGPLITVKISKASLDLIRQCKPRSTPAPPKKKPITPKSSPVASSFPESSSSQTAIRGLAARRRNAAQAKSRIYKRLIKPEGRCRVNLFDIGFISTPGSKVNVGKFSGFMGTIGPNFDPGSQKVQKSVKKFISPPKPTIVEGENDEAVFDEFRRSLGLRKWVYAVTLHDIGSKPVTCPICEQPVPVTTLATHKAEHTIRCHYEGCDVDVRIGDVVRHGTSHLRTLDCEQCDYVAASKESLWCHQNRHYGVKPLICIECGDSFSFASSADRHFRLKHCGEGAAAAAAQLQQGGED